MDLYTRADKKRAIEMKMTQREYFAEYLGINNETWADVLKCTLSDEELNALAFVSERPSKYTIWTKEYVYFPVSGFAGTTITAFVPRHPCDHATEVQ